jgi:hypothetical protein
VSPIFVLLCTSLEGSEQVVDGGDLPWKDAESRRGNGRGFQFPIDESPAGEGEASAGAKEVVSVQQSLFLHNRSPSTNFSSPSKSPVFFEGRGRAGMESPRDSTAGFNPSSLQHEASVSLNTIESGSFFTAENSA